MLQSMHAPQGCRDHVHATYGYFINMSREARFNKKLESFRLCVENLQG